MPGKIRKRSEVGGLAQPDQVMTGLTTTYSFLDRYKYFIVGGFLAVIVVLLAVSWISSYMENRDIRISEEFYDAFKLADAPVGENATERGGVPAFKTNAEKFGKLAEGLQTFLADHESHRISDTARVALAAALLELSNNTEALTQLNAVAESLEGTALSPVLHETLAYAHLRQGQVDLAVSEFKKMGEMTANSYLKARSLIHLGDLVNPFTSVQGSTKNAEEARKLYQEALDLLPEPVEQALDPIVTLTRQEIQLRLSLLNLG
jgi:tetratricopeptide (TPR) repeat protein